MSDDDIKRLRELAERADPTQMYVMVRDVIPAVLDRLEAAERERDEARDCAQESADIMRRVRDDRDALRAERDAMATLLREARGVVQAYCADGHGRESSGVLLDRIDDALAAKEQSK
jgi:hypothetical protein